VAGRALLRAKSLAAIVELLGIGKKEAAGRLAALKADS